MIATQVQLYNITDENKNIYIDNLNKSKTDILLLTLCEFFLTGKERQKQLDEYKERIDFFKDNGYEPIIWTNTLGWGIPRDEYFEKRFSHSTELTSFDGLTTTAVCTLDNDFCEAMCDNIRDFIKLGVNTILLDDDLVQSVRPGAFCTCEKHRRMFFEKTGKNYTPKEIQNLFTGSPSKDRKAFLDVMGESMMNFCRALRKAADDISPKVKIGLCASYTHYDIEGVDIREMLTVLAGEGNKPFLRLSGAPYWTVFSQRFPGQNIGAVAEFIKMQAAWFDNYDIDLLDENDSYPRDSRIVPTSICEIYDKIMQTIPKIVRHKYFMCFNPLNGDSSYLDAHIRNMPRDVKLENYFKGKAQYGVRIYQNQRLLENAYLPDIYPGDKEFMSMFSQPYAGIFASHNGFPTKYSGEGSGICFGENARYLSEKEISRGLILDMKAALIITSRGYDIGIEGTDNSDGFNGYYHADSTVVKNELVVNNSSDVFCEPNGKFYNPKLKVGAEISAYIKNENNSSPYCIRYKNALGYKFSILCFDADTLSYGITGMTTGILFSKTSKKILRAELDFVSNKYIPSTEHFKYGEHLSISSDGRGDYALLLCNESSDSIHNASISFDKNIEITDLDGEWRAENNKLICSYIPACSFASVLIREK